MVTRGGAAALFSHTHTQKTRTLLTPRFFFAECSAHLRRGTLRVSLQVPPHATGFWWRAGERGRMALSLSLPRREAPPGVESAREREQAHPTALSPLSFFVSLQRKRGSAHPREREGELSGTGHARTHNQPPRAPRAPEAPPWRAGKTEREKESALDNGRWRRPARSPSFSQPTRPSIASLLGALATALALEAPHAFLAPLECSGGRWGGVGGEKVSGRARQSSRRQVIGTTNAGTAQRAPGWANPSAPGLGHDMETSLGGVRGVGAGGRGCVRGASSCVAAGGGARPLWSLVLSPSLPSRAGRAPSPTKAGGGGSAREGKALPLTERAARTLARISQSLWRRER